MPLVRISLRKGRPADFGGRVGEVVYRAMVDTIDVPANDHFRVITEHDHDGLVYDAGYLGIARSDGVIIIQITLSEGRTVEREKALYRTIAERLRTELGVRTEDVFVNLVEVKKKTGRSVTAWPRTCPETEAEMKLPVIGRIWHGRTHKELADEYLEYVYEQGISKIRQKPGNLGAQLFLRIDGDAAEFTVISCRVAHPDKDPEYLLELPEYVEVVELHANAWH